MTRKLALGILLCSTLAHAEGPAELTIAQFDPSQAVAPISVVEGPGIKIGEGTVLHPVFGMETGFTSNVFYNEEAKPAGILRVLAQVGTASLNEQRLNPNAPNQIDAEEPPGGYNKGSFQYNANVRLAWDQPLSTDDTVTDTSGLGIGAMFHAMVAPMNPVTFGIREDFIRSIRAANFETPENLNRDINTLRLLLLFHPQGRSLSAYLYYQNTIDIFENDLGIYPDRIAHRVGLHPTWQLYPRTQLFGDFSWGINSGLGSDAPSTMKIDSYPLALRVGLSTLLTLKTTFNISGGYTNGFYASGANYSRPLVDTAITYRYSPLGRVGLAYSYIHQDSVNANYYRDHILRLTIQQLFVPFAIAIEPELHFREYVGVTLAGASSDVRDDVIFQVVGGIHYNFRNWLAVVADYKFSTVQTDFTYMSAGDTVDLNYTRHELLAGLRIAL
jgi:hypothetical protein